MEIFWQQELRLLEFRQKTKYGSFKPQENLGDLIKFLKNENKIEI
jgi:hypothetical protein